MRCFRPNFLEVKSSSYPGSLLFSNWKRKLLILNCSVVQKHGTLLEACQLMFQHWALALIVRWKRMAGIRIFASNVRTLFFPAKKSQEAGVDLIFKPCLPWHSFYSLWTQNVLKRIIIWRSNIEHFNETFESCFEEVQSKILWCIEQLYLALISVLTLSYLITVHVRLFIFKIFEQKMKKNFLIKQITANFLTIFDKS